MQNLQGLTVVQCRQAQHLQRARLGQHEAWIRSKMLCSPGLRLKSESTVHLQHAGLAQHNLLVNARGTARHEVTNLRSAH